MSEAKGTIALADDADFLLPALRRMTFVRAFEQACWDHSLGENPAIVGSVHLCAGQEAIPVGACAALTDADRVIATYRGHGWALEAGLPADAVFAEVCHRATGVNGGRAGSALIMGADHKFVAENSIVGAGGPIAAGIAMALQHSGSNGVVLVSFGDGAMNQGALHEALVFATARKLPVIFICENNGWSELTPTSRIIPFERLARRGHGYGLPSATIDGGDPLVVRSTVEIAAARARAGEGPSLIECKTVRLWGHYNKDLEHYRPKADRAAAAASDPIVLLRERLVRESVLTADAADNLQKSVSQEVEQLVRTALAAPEPDPATARDHVISSVATELPRLAATAPEQWTYQRAVNEALKAELQSRPELLVFGEDVGHAGGIFGCTRNLQKEFGEARVFDTPIAEAAILGSAVGAAIAGMRPVAEIMWMDFMLVAMDQLINQAANVRYVSRGKVSAPLVVRVQQGVTPGSCAQHSQSLEAILAHIPGLKVGLPSTPQDAYDMLRAAIADPDPCIVIEARSLYQTTGPVSPEVSSVGTARLRRDGTDVALVSWGAMANVAVRAAEKLAREGIDAAMLDLRWLSPLDMASLIAVTQQCGGRALIVHEANISGGFGGEIMARLLEQGFTGLRRLGTPDMRIPAAPVLQRALLPNEYTIVAAARELMHAVEPAQERRAMERKAVGAI
jgi:2-oxoisovalerate dehydrogenase E1 component